MFAYISIPPNNNFCLPKFEKRPNDINEETKTDMEIFHVMINVLASLSPSGQGNYGTRTGGMQCLPPPNAHVTQFDDFSKIRQN